ncbi:small RNA 2'-O-methyltransferase isoform X2 [Drosophila montana]
MQPKIVIFSTPNSDFNIIFTRFNPLLPNGFRHHDHKFEWTREQFKSWCLAITEKYPNYMFSLLGVGEPPPGDESVGYVSQMALFVRKDMLGMPLPEPLKVQPLPDIGASYKRLHLVDFPFNKDNRTQEEKIWAEIELQLHRCTKDEDNYDNEKCMYKMSILELLDRLAYLGATRQILDQLLEQHKKPIENGFVLIEEEPDCNYNEELFEEYEQTAPVSSADEENWDN